MINAIYPLGLPIAISLVAYNSLLTGLFVLLKRRDAVGIVYLIFASFVFLWGIGISFMLNNDLTKNAAEWWGWFSQVAALFIPVTWLHFVLLYTNELKKKRWWLLYSIYLATFLILPFTFTDSFIPAFKEMVGIKRYPVPGPSYVAFTLLFAAIIPLTFRFLYSAWRNAGSHEKKTDYKLLIFAQLYGFVTGSLSFLPVYGIPLPQYNLLLMPLWQFLLAYAMIRHHLFSLEEVLQATHRDKLAAIGTLATSINHEIRNPLYIVQGLSQSYLSNLQERYFSSNEETISKSKEVLEKIAAQADRAMEIMKNFSIFAKREKDGLIGIKTVSLYETLDRILPLVRHELELDKIDFTQRIPEDLSPLKIDRRHLEEILFNLIVNSCQAMKEMGGKIELAAAQHNGSVQIEVKDNGPGVPTNRLRKIFEPFYTTKEEGTGLGLYVTKQLVERNGGKISVKSKLGQGTTFALEFKK